jgi:hypothetical protein
MMRLNWIALGVALTIAGPASANSEMRVDHFLVKANALKKKGPMALFSSDLKLLMNRVKADFGTIRTERLAAESAGRPVAFCPPKEGAKITDKDVLGAMEAVPPPRRAATSTRDALKAMLVRRYPCR